MVIKTKIEIESVEYSDPITTVVNRNTGDFNATSNFSITFPNDSGQYGNTFSLNDDVKIYAADENQRILNNDDAVTTVNYSDSSKDSVSNISTASAVLGRKVTDTYNNSGATTLVLTRVVANV